MRAIRMRAAALGLLFASAALGALPASATHWTGAGTLAPLVAFSGEVNRFTFTLNSSAAEAVDIFQVRMVACWHSAGSGSDIKPDDGTVVTVPALGSIAFTGDVDVPPRPDGLCHTAIVVKGKAAGDAAAGYADYHFDVNYTARPPLTVSIEADTLSGTPPLAVHFNASGSGGEAPYEFAWQFGDGGNGTGASPAHTFTVVGRFSTTVSATDAHGRRAAAVAVVWAFSGLAVNASVTIARGDAPLGVGFRAAVVGASGAVRLNWTFGDGKNESGDVVLHNYPDPGNYTARVEARDDVGGTASASVSVVVDSPVSVTLVVYPPPARGPPPFTLSARAVVAGAAEPLAYHWIFGDGAIIVGNNVTHTYTVSGNYKLVLHVTNPASGRIYSAEYNVTIEPAPPVRPQPGNGADLAIGAVIAAALFCTRVRKSHQR